MLIKTQKLSHLRLDTHSSHFQLHCVLELPAVMNELRDCAKEVKN